MSIFVFQAADSIAQKLAGNSEFKAMATRTAPAAAGAASEMMIPGSGVAVGGAVGQIAREAPDATAQVVAGVVTSIGCGVLSVVAPPLLLLGLGWLVLKSVFKD